MRDLQLSLVPLADGTRITITDRLTPACPVSVSGNTHILTLSVSLTGLSCAPLPLSRLTRARVVRCGCAYLADIEGTPVIVAFVHCTV